MPFFSQSKKTKGLLLLISILLSVFLFTEGAFGQICREAGESCNVNLGINCCSGLECMGTMFGENVCVNKKCSARGENCAENNDCCPITGLFCDEATKKCCATYLNRKIGEPCICNMECTFLFCENNVCIDPSGCREEGNPCGSDGSSCCPGLECKNDKCIKESFQCKENGESCGGSNECCPGLECEGGQCKEPSVDCKWQKEDCGGGSCDSEEREYICGPEGCQEGECSDRETKCMTDAVCKEVSLSCNPNGMIEGAEQCDGEELGGENCESLGYSGGDLSCSSFCTFDTSDCEREDGGGGGGGDGGGGGGGGTTIISGGGTTGGGEGSEEDLVNPTPFLTVVDLINQIISFIWRLSIVFAPAMFLVGGFFIMTAGDDPVRLEKGKKTLLYTAIGLGVIIFSKALISLMKEVIGAKDEQSFLQMADALKVFCFSGGIKVRKAIFKKQ